LTKGRSREKKFVQTWRKRKKGGCTRPGGEKELGEVTNEEKKDQKAQGVGKRMIRGPRFSQRKKGKRFPFSGPSTGGERGVERCGGGGGT